IIRANATGPAIPTPNTRVLIPAAAGEYVKGQEHAWLVTNVSVEKLEDFDNPAGPKYLMYYRFDPPDPAHLDPSLGIPPDPDGPLPPGLKPFGGVQIVFESASENYRRADEKFLLANHPDVNAPDTDHPYWVSNQYDAQQITFNVYFVSADVDRKANSI